MLFICYDPTVHLSERRNKRNHRLRVPRGLYTDVGVKSPETKANPIYLPKAASILGVDYSRVLIVTATVCLRKPDFIWMYYAVEATNTTPLEYFLHR